ncbi:MAG: amidohydrolase [Desulfarculaceae bacterium]|nr:amidohydrolase [Desulfarculaceae bacterium]MCF8073859.1 amidohydrolase [Desulfarculaceae bacterium]MCF8102839.1 amidohydrolase [Desulfarculaceae bacterium]MCF8116283.1 amidohydrolase [Desulfarculaceae bacterium]
MSSGNLRVTGGPLWAGPGMFWPSGAVLASDGVVVYAGDAALAPPLPEASELDADGGLIMPGLINAHCHAAMVLFRGLADDLPLDAWLNQHIFPAEARWVDERMTEVCTRLAVAEMLLSGTTTVGDSYFCASGAARAYEQTGMRAVLAQGLIDFPAPGVPDPAQGLAVCREFVERWSGVSPLITPAIFAHSPYTCSPRTLGEAAALREDLGVRLYTHLAETASEVAQSAETHGASPVAWLDELGLLQRLDAAVHCVWLAEGEAELLAQRGVAVIACPGSNSKLGSGWADIPTMLADGCVVGLGTDGAASNNNLDLFGEIGLAARLAKLRTGDPASLPAEQAVDLALAGSAAALGLEEKVGRLEPGFACDLIVMDLSAPRLTPLYDAPSHLTYAASGNEVRHTVVDGQVLVKDRQLTCLDLDQAMASVRELAARVAGG